MKNKLNSAHPRNSKAQQYSVSPSLTKNWSTNAPIGLFISSCPAAHLIW
ncbi:hypothetical protein AB6735_19970 [Mucilaginibacter sp. RCC_168]